MKEESLTYTNDARLAGKPTKACFCRGSNTCTDLTCPLVQEQLKNKENSHETTN